MKAIREQDEGIMVDIEVTPGSAQFTIKAYNPWRNRIEVKISAPPIKGKANQEIIKEFSHLTKREVILVTGQKSRQKTIKIFNITKKDFGKILKQFLI